MSPTEIADIGITWIGPSVAMHTIDNINNPKGIWDSIFWGVRSKQGTRGPGTRDRGPEDQGPGNGAKDRGPGPRTGPILLHGRLWDPHSNNNKSKAPGFCSALQNTLVQQLFVNSADEKQETKLLCAICIMSLRHISLQNS